jgi:hypothetical protein
MARLFWLSDEAWARIEPHLPHGQPGKPRVDDRRVISGILHVLKVGSAAGGTRPPPTDHTRGHSIHSGVGEARPLVSSTPSCFAIRREGLLAFEERTCCGPKALSRAL